MLFHIIFLGVKKHNGKWENQRLLVSEKDINILEGLIRKSILFACGILPEKHGSDFVLASDLLNDKKVDKSFT